MARTTELASPQRVLVTIEADMKEQADTLFKSQNISFSEGVRQALGAALKSKGATGIAVAAETKRDAEKVLADMGLDTETAVSMFLKEVARTGCIPFAVQSGRGSYRYVLVPVEQVQSKASQSE